MQQVFKQLLQQQSTKSQPSETNQPIKVIKPTDRPSDPRLR